jgi:hypothetical protein
MALFLQLFPFYFAVWILILLIPVRINLFFQRENKDDFMTIRVNTFFSIVRFQIEVPFLKQSTPLDLTVEAEIKAGEDELVREEHEKVSVFDISPEKVKQHLAFIHKNRQALWFIARYMSRAVTVESLGLRLQGGTADAAQTGLLVGMFWSVAGGVLALAEQKLKFRKRPIFRLEPDFGHTPVFNVRLDTTVSFRIGHISLVGLILLAAKIRGSDKKIWKNIQSRA